MDGPRKNGVGLTCEQRQRLETLTRNGADKAKKIVHARVLLMSDRDHPRGRYSDEQISAALGIHVNTVARVRKAFVLRGEGSALSRKPRLTPPVPPKLDGAAEAHLVAICCSPAPAGRVRWTMQLLANELTGRGIVTSISAETVRLRLKKTICSPGRRSGSASPSARAGGLFRGWRRSSSSTPLRTTPTSR